MRRAAFRVAVRLQERASAPPARRTRHGGRAGRAPPASLDARLPPREVLRSSHGMPRTAPPSAPRASSRRASMPAENARAPPSAPQAAAERRSSRPSRARPSCDGRWRACRRRPPPSVPEAARGRPHPSAGPRGDARSGARAASRLERRVPGEVRRPARRRLEQRVRGRLLAARAVPPRGSMDRSSPGALVPYVVGTHGGSAGRPPSPVGRAGARHCGATVQSAVPRRACAVQPFVGACYWKLTRRASIFSSSGASSPRCRHLDDLPDLELGLAFTRVRAAAAPTRSPPPSTSPADSQTPATSSFRRRERARRSRSAGSRTSRTRAPFEL